MSLPDPALEGAAHVVQLALTPVFLLSGVAALLNVFATRYGRVADQAHALSEQKDDTAAYGARLRLLRLRSRALDFAVVLAALAGGSTCGAALALFLGAVRGSAGATLLFWLFGGGLVLTVAALGAFTLEMLLAARGVRHLLDRSERAAGWTLAKRLHRRDDEGESGPESVEMGGHDGDGAAIHVATPV